jgi:membrane protein
MAHSVLSKRFWLGSRSATQFARDLASEIRDDNVANGAAALAFYLMLALFPAAIFLLSLLPYLPIPHLEQAIMDLLRQVLPGDAAQLFASTVRSVVSTRRGGLLSVGFLATLWSASSGLYAVMKQLNVTYDVTETRSFFKARGIALLLMLLFMVLIVGSLGLVVFGGVIQAWLGELVGWSRGLLLFFAALRWVIIGAAAMLGFALVYYLGPDVQQKFRYVTPGSVFGVLGMLVASLAFRLYVSRLAHYDKTYGSIGAVIVLLLWLFVTGWVLLLGAELNALIEHYSPGSKRRGERTEGARAGEPLHPAPA